MSNCNKELVELLNSMDEYIKSGEEILINSNVNEEFTGRMNAFIEGFIMVEKVIKEYSKKLNTITLGEKNKLADGLESSIEKINSNKEYLLNDYLECVAEPFIKWKSVILNNIL
ncbi:MAG: hypothetical protein ACLSV2_04000 [Clostridium sp.]